MRSPTRLVICCSTKPGDGLTQLTSTLPPLNICRKLRRRWRCKRVRNGFHGSVLLYRSAVRQGRGIYVVREAKVRIIRGPQVANEIVRQRHQPVVGHWWAEVIADDIHISHIVERDAARAASPGKRCKESGRGIGQIRVGNVIRTQRQFGAMIPVRTPVPGGRNRVVNPPS